MKAVKKVAALLLGFCLMFNLTACGTILHPERKGQSSGRLDASIVILDAIGLLFYLVPGVIAFAVDFNNGTIYLPGGSASTLSDEEMEKIAVNGKVDKEALEALIEVKTNQSVELDDFSVSYLDSPAELPASLQTSRIAILTD